MGIRSPFPQCAFIFPMAKDLRGGLAFKDEDSPCASSKGQAR
jgi:hypothetical protein